MSLASLRTGSAINHLWVTLAEVVPTLRFVGPMDMAQLIWDFGQPVKNLEEERQKLHHAVIHALLNRCLEEGIEFGPHEVAMVMHGSATAGITHKAQRQYAERASNDLSKYSDRHCGHIAWALATTSQYLPQVFNKVQKRVCEAPCGHISASNILWAFAKVNHPNCTDLFTHLTDEVLRQKCFMKAKEWSNVVWACGTVKYTRPGLFDFVEQHLMKGPIVDQQMSNVLWSLAVCGVDDALMDKIAMRLAREPIEVLREAFTRPQALSNTLWALASRSRFTHLALYRTLAHLCTEQVHRFKPAELTNVAWALARTNQLGVREYHNFFVAATPIVECNFEHFPPLSVSNFVYSCARQLFCPPVVLSAVINRGMWDTYKPQELSLLAWSFAILHCSEGIPEMGLNLVKSRERLEKCAPVDVGQMVWAMAVTKTYDPKVMLPLLQELESVPAKQHEVLMQCRAALLGFSVEHFGGSMDALLDAFPSFQKSQFSTKIAVTPLRPGESSKVHEEISARLRKMGVEHENEYATYDGLYLDIALVDQRLAVEIHGIFHYLSLMRDATSTPRTLLLEGPTRFKERILRKRGWNVVHVCVEDYKQLGNEEKTEFLHRLIGGEKTEVPHVHLLHSRRAKEDGSIKMDVVPWHAEK